MFFDANSTSFSRDGKLQIFEGDVVAVAGGVIVTADKIELNHNLRHIKATGHVMLLTEDQILVGESITYNMKSMDFLCVNCSMRVGDIETVKNISISILGFSAKEIEFEKQRGLRLSEIQIKKKKLKAEYEQNPDSNLISKYALLLEQEALISKQESSALAQMNQEKRDRYKLRRKYWEEVISEHKHNVKTGFFMVEGKTIKKISRMSYTMERPFLTPCKCEDETAPWGIAASSIDAEIEEYADIYNCVLQIKGVPVLYFPYLKVPLKTKRQSGLLTPGITSRSSSGFIYTQPLFIDIADDMDSTVTLNYFSKRGPKLGIEYRYQYRQYSGFLLQLDGLQDKEWAKAKKRRDDSLSYYESKNPENLDAINSRLYYPNNKYRGSVSLYGMNYFTPRLSILENIRVYSDHRYSDDLDVSGDIQAAFENDNQVSFFNVSQIKLNYDGSNFYVGLGSDMADGVFTNKSYSGQQIPFYLTFKSKLYGLDLKVLPHNSYVYGGFDHYSLIDIKDEGIATSNSSFVGRGNWDGMYLKMVTPLSTGGVAKIDHFVGGDFRRISYEGLSDKFSTVRSFNTGFNLSIPLSGDMVLYKNSDDTQKVFKHNMNLVFTYDIRPSPVWNGEYGTLSDDDNVLYFATDKLTKDKKVISTDVSYSDIIKRHHRIEFRTIHSWHLLNKAWEVQPRDPSFNKKTYDSYYDQATSELVSGLSPLNYDDVYVSDKWKINRYRLLDSDSFNLLNLETKISYDFVLRDERENQIKELEAKGEQKDETKLSQPWSTLYVSGNTNISNFRFYLDMDYNFYYEDFTSQIFSLYLPTFLRTNLSLQYQIGSEFSYDEVNQSFEKAETYTGTINVGSNIMSSLDFLGYYSRRTSKNEGIDNDYETKFGFVYKPKTDCWSLSFLRWKKFGVRDSNAEYILRLSIILFSGQTDIPFNLL